MIILSMRVLKKEFNQYSKSVLDESVKSEELDLFGIPLSEASYQDMPGSRKRRRRSSPIERIVKRVYDRRKKSGIKPLVDPKKSSIPGIRDFKKG